MLTSLFFVFGTIAEFSVVLLVNRTMVEDQRISRQKKNDSKNERDRIIEQTDDGRKNKTFSILSNSSNLWGLSNTGENNSKILFNRNFFKNLDVITKIDVVAFLFFIHGFLGFNIIYYNNI